MKRAPVESLFSLTLNFSLVKMVYKTAEEHGREPRWPEIEQAIRRNFGGLDEIDPVKIFKEHVPFSRNEMVGVLNNLLICFIVTSAIRPRYFRARLAVHTGPSKAFQAGLVRHSVSK